MDPEMNDGRILAQLERRLAQDDPALAETMEVLNQQFGDEPGEGAADSRQEDDKRHRWWLVAITVFSVLAFLGLFIAALLNSNPDQTDKQPGPPQGLAPAVSLYTQHRSRPEPRRRLPDPSHRHRPATRTTTCAGSSRAYA
ncbi:DUF3040 domain-containing protein [Streptomyces massasporeus]|uniref:DUF3040 domain-containing protein n=1 Tax=Streptomyces massasporeus TaxID=67324 RepID=UPI00379E82D0